MLDLTFAQHATFTPAARMVPIFINKSFLAFHMSTVLSKSEACSFECLWKKTQVVIKTARSKWLNQNISKSEILSKNEFPAFLDSVVLTPLELVLIL